MKKKQWFDDWRVTYKPTPKAGSVEIYLPNDATKKKKYIFVAKNKEEYEDYYNLAMLMDCALSALTKND